MSPHWLTALMAETEAGRPVVLVTAVTGENAGAKLLVGAGGVLAGGLGALNEHAAAAAGAALRMGRPATLDAGGGTTLYLEPYLPPPTLVIVGAGHVAQPLATGGKLAGFHVAVLDDRSAYATRSRFPDADAVICDEFRHGLDQLQLGVNHHVVLVTRGHQHDLDCLRHVVDLPLAYIGMIGSRRRVMGVFQRLMDEGVAPESLQRVHAPIGLDIGAETPGEIAISIVAELVKLRHGGTGESLSRGTRGSVHRFRRQQT